MPRSSPPERSTYRHGDLRRALLEAGVALAREGGPAAIALREATRRVGVAPNAAYRHFSSHAELLAAVRVHALAAAARSMQAELDAVEDIVGRSTKARRAARARARLRAVGAGYVHFAMAEPGLFRTAFTSMEMPRQKPVAANRGAGGEPALNPFELLGGALDDMVQAGVLVAERREEAEYVAWSAVHGLAMLALEGPLQQVPKRRIQALTSRVLDMADRGI